MRHDDAHVARHHLERLAQLAGEEVADLRRLLDEVEVPAAGRGHALQELLGEAVAQAEGGGGDAALPELAGVVGQRRRVRLADVGVPVGEQQAARDGVAAGAVAVRRDVGAAGEPALAQRRAAAGLDEADALLGGGDRRVRGRRRRHDGVDALVEDDDAEAVVGAEERQRVDGRLLGQGRGARRPSSRSDRRRRPRARARASGHQRSTARRGAGGGSGRSAPRRGGAIGRARR
ncbi:MAG: hypothetical protein U1F43_09305 [Myxococcota bacterium]